MALAYLLDPVFEIQNSAGKPATNGWLEVYVHGSRERYYCASDFDGTLHPFKIPLDSLGSNIVLADDDKSYDVYVYNRYGSLLMSRYAVTTGAGNLVRIVSGDGSIDVTWTDNGHIRTYDIRQAEDGEDLLDWFKSIGSSRIEDTTIYRPGCTSGTMEMGEYGPRAGGSQYYHATAHVQAVKTDTEPYYDKVLVRFYARSSEGVLTLLESSTCIVDWSQGLTQEFDVSCDLNIASDCEICVSIEGQDVNAGGFELANLYLHRVYSGTPRIPSGVISRAEVESALEGKQDVIGDLSAIRAGAEAGATAVQPGDLATVATSGSYNDLSNKPDLSGFATKSEVTSGLATKQDTLIAGANITIEDNVISATGGGGGGGGGTTYTAGNGIVIDNDEISVDTSAIQEKLTTTEIDAVDSGINSTKVSTYDTHVSDTTIHVTSTDKTNWNAKEDASNKKQSIDDSSTTDFPSSKAVADFVNSSVATATARFLGSFTLTDLGLTYSATNAQIATALDNHAWPSGTTPTNNDYVYVEIQDPQTTSIDDEVRRFKFNGTVWAYEYTLNNSSFTAAEKAAIDSGITATAVTTYSGHVADSTIHVTSSDKTAWNAKQDAISDLATIRSGASAGATAVQPGDIDQTYNSSSTNAQSGTAVAGAIAGVRQVPTTQSTDNGKVLGVTDANGALGWVAQNGGGGTQVQADWTETDSTDPSYIQHKPTELGLSAGTNITLTESGNSLTISANFTQVQSDWDETNTASPAYLDNKPLITRVISGALSENSTNSNLMDICDLVDQYSSSGDVLMVKGSWSGATDAMWRFIEKFQSGPDTYTYLFKLVVEDLITAYVYILYDTAIPTAYIDYSSTYPLSTQTLYNGRCININYNQSTQHDEINWTTTAGITDIQQVAALPANPVSTVLYLIPAT